MVSFAPAWSGRRSTKKFVASGQTIRLLVVYAKAKSDNLSAGFLAELKREVEDE